MSDFQDNDALDTPDSLQCENSQPALVFYKRETPFEDSPALQALLNFRQKYDYDTTLHVKSPGVKEV